MERLKKDIGRRSEIQTHLKVMDNIYIKPYVDRCLEVESMVAIDKSLI